MHAANRKMTNGSSAQHLLQYTEQKLIREKQKCGNPAHIRSANQMRFISTKPKNCQIGEVPNTRCAK